jgi:predicted transcriptional regulator
MAGRHNFDELRAKMTPARRARNDRAVKTELRRMLLSELRRTAGMTQVKVAKSMGITQPTLSHLEGQDDMQVSTLQRIVKALGGELEIIAKIPSGQIALSQFSK